jgi:hypothetical protein
MLRANLKYLDFTLSSFCKNFHFRGCVLERKVVNKRQNGKHAILIGREVQRFCRTGR